MSRRYHIPEALDCDIPGKRRFSILRETFELDEKYEPQRGIGKGAYGFVCSAKDTTTGGRVAIKKIKSPFRNRIEAIRCLREVNLLRHIQHPNIIQIHGIMKPANEQTFEDVYVVYECMDTDLHQIIRSKQSLTDDHYKYIIMQTLRGLMYLHSANIMHRDLKPSNLLLNANCDLKIADFGLARSRDSREDMSQYVVTRWYRAPEILLMSDYSKAIDVWSVGCILGELLTGSPLFRGTDVLATLHQIIKLIGKPQEEDLQRCDNSYMKQFIQNLPETERKLERSFPNANPQAIDLLNSLLQFNPVKRPSAAEALNHPWFNDIRDRSCEIVATEDVFEYEFDEDNLDERAIRDLTRREIQIWCRSQQKA